ncbi:MAG: AP endonuclease [Desulfuromonas sp.]|nr:MAG: AP endonuclease [Desulfuromonas sp.]
MHDKLHIHLPGRQLKKRLKWLLKNRFQPEIAWQGEELDSLDLNFLQTVGDTLGAEGLDITIHAPFFDLNPGSHDPDIEAITRKRFNQTLDVADTLRASLIVFHPGYDRWRYDRKPNLWHEQSLLFWPPLLKRAEQIGCRMTLENIYEEHPRTLADLLDALDSPWLGHCFDVGHWNLFCKTPLDNWFELLGRHTRHIHLHDNRGTADDHLPVDQGQIDFTALFRHIYALQNPPSLTLEAHSARDLKKSLSAVQPYLQKRHELS